MNVINVKEKIDKLIDEIVILEDDVKLLEKKAKTESEENSFENAIMEIERNKSRICLLTEIIESEKLKSEKEVSKKEGEKDIIIKQIKEIQQKISSSNALIINSSVLEIELNNQDKIMIDMLKERKEKERLLHVNEENTKKLKENINMLKEEKTLIENEIVNLISHKESLEEIIKNYTIFINDPCIRESLQALEDEFKFEFYSFEIKVLDKVALIRNISKILSSLLKLDLTNNKYFASLCINSLKLFSSNSLDSNDIFEIFSKKVFEYVIYNKDIKKIEENKDKIDFEKLALLLKLITKISYYEEVISQKINFINKEYKNVKKEILNQLREGANEYNKLNTKIEKLKDNEKEVLHRIETINQDLKSSVTIQKKQKDKYQEKKETLEIFLKDFEDEIINLKEGLLIKLNEYTSQIEEYQRANKKLESIFIERNRLEKNDEKFKGELLKKRIQIAEKYRSIKEYVRKMNESDTQRSNLINSYIHKINETLDLKEEGKILNPKENDINNEIIRKMEFLRQMKRTDDNKTNNMTIKTKTYNCNSSQLSYLNQSTRRYEKESSPINKTEIINDISDLKLDDLSHSNPNIKYGVKQNKLKYPNNRMNLRMNNISKKDNNNTCMRSSQSFDQKTKCYSSKTEKSKEQTLNNSFESKLLIQKDKDDLYNKSIYKINVSFRVDICSPEEFTFLESLRPLFEGSIVYKRVYNKKQEEFNPLEARVSPENVGFVQVFMNLDKSFRMITITIENFKAKTDIFIDKIERIEVSKHTKNAEYIKKIYKNLEKQNFDPEEYFNSLGSCNSMLLNVNNRNKFLNAYYYLMIIVLRTGIKVEVLFSSFENYKSWRKGLESLVINKSRLALLKPKIL